MRIASAIVAVSACALAMCATGSAVRAADIWDAGGGGDTSWANAANWSSGVPANMANVTFGTGGSEAALLYGLNVNAITFNRAGDFQVLGNTAYGAPTWVREFNIYGGVTVTQPNTYTISVRTYRVMLKANQTMDVVSGGKLLFNTAPTGTHHFGGFKGYTVTKTGDGVLEFAGGAAVTYLTELGSLDIQGGSVLVSTAGMSYMGALSGSGDLTATGGIVIGQDVDGVFQGHLDLGGAISMFKDDSGKLTISGAGGYITGTGEVALRGGMLELDNSTVNRNNRLTGAMISLNGGVLKLIGNDTVNTVENASAGATLAVWGGAGELNINHGASANATISFAGVGHDDPADPAGGAGMLTFTGADIGASGTAPSSHVMVSGAPGIINDSIVGWWRVGDEFASYDGALGVLPLAVGHASRTGDLNTATTSKNVLATSAQTLTGNVTANSLKIQGGHGIDLGGHTLTLDTGGLIQTGSANSTGIHSGSLAATGDQFYVQVATDLNIGASVSGITLTKMGLGKLTLGDVALSQGVVFCEGDIDVNNNAAMTLKVNNAGRAGELSKGGSGILTVSGGTLIGDVYVNDGTMKFGGGSIFAPTSTVHVIGDGVLQATYASQWYGMPEGWVSLEGGGRYMFYSATDGYSAADLKLTVVDEGEVYNPGTGERHIEVLSGPGRLVKWGTNPICFDNSSADLSGFTGTLDVAEGTFRVAVGKRPTNAAGFHVRSGATLNWYNPVSVDDYVFSGDGTILVTGGTFSVNGCTLRPGASVGTLAVTGALTMNAGTNSVLDIEVADDAGGNDVLAVTGPISGLGNTDVVFNLPAPSKAKFDVNTGVSATFLTAAGISGSFAAVSLSAAMPANVASHYSLGLGDIDTSSGTARALVLTGACWTGHDGDSNLDDEVNVLDLANLANNFSRSDANVSWLTSDYNLDGLVDVLDLAKLANSFGWASGAVGAAPVPEPFTLTLLALGTVAVVRRRRR